ncbi:uncharacterized protein LOC142356405 [Convolutriloba macropyga]|uniref:uncharacterized protein LOC142356405 n=1 Tax=Convolutriloba macropyga TaxID=536237 RepID=UPI003F520F51
MKTWRQSFRWVVFATCRYGRFLIDYGTRCSKEQDCLDDKTTNYSKCCVSKICCTRPEYANLNQPCVYLDDCWGRLHCKYFEKSDTSKCVIEVYTEDESDQPGNEWVIVLICVLCFVFLAIGIGVGVALCCFLGCGPCKKGRVTFCEDKKKKSNKRSRSRKATKRDTSQFFSNRVSNAHARSKLNQKDKSQDKGSPFVDEEQFPSHRQKRVNARENNQNATSLTPDHSDGGEEGDEKSQRRRNFSPTHDINNTASWRNKNKKTAESGGTDGGKNTNLSPNYRSGRGGGGAGEEGYEDRSVEYSSRYEQSTFVSEDDTSF